MILQVTLAALAVFVVFGATLALVCAKLLYVCQPNEVLVFSGIGRKRAGGRCGYRIIRGGRALRAPLFERVDRMDLTNMIVEVKVRNAYSRGGIPLSVEGIANLKVPGEEPLLTNALERFLGRSREAIMSVARESLEGNLRGVLATLTPEQVNQDKEAFAARLAAEAEQDFNTLGLVLDTLKIQNVADDVRYLESIGRQRGAQIRRQAQVAEAEATAEAEERKWHNTMNAEVAKLDAQVEIARRENDRRIADARTRRAALCAKERADVDAHVAEATAELAEQEARIEQVRLKLHADIIKPAEASMVADQEAARGAAAQVLESGLATAGVLTQLADSCKVSGPAAREALLMQKLVPLTQRMSRGLANLKVDRLAVVGGGKDGSTATKLIGLSEQVRAATGLDVPALLQAKLAEG